MTEEYYLMMTLHKNYENAQRFKEISDQNDLALQSDIQDKLEVLTRAILHLAQLDHNAVYQENKEFVLEQIIEALEMVKREGLGELALGQSFIKNNVKCWGLA